MRYAIMVSGNGGFAKFIHKNRDIVPHGEFGAIISDRDCPGIQFFLQKTAVPAYMFNYKDFGSKELFEAEIVAQLKACRIDVLFLNYDRLIGPVLLNAFPDKIFNLHLSLLPLFKGFKAIEKSFESDALFYGATIHLVDETVDGGPIVSQVLLAKRVHDDLNSYTHRLFENAAVLFLDTISKVCDGQLIIEKQRPFFTNAEYGNSNFNPALSIDASRAIFSI